MIYIYRIYVRIKGLLQFEIGLVLGRSFWLMLDPWIVMLGTCCDYRKASRGHLGAILEYLEAFFEHLTSNYAMKVLTLKKCQKCNTYCTFGTSGRAQRFQVPAKMGYI